MVPERRSHTTISVVTPSYNQGRFIRRTIDSVLSQNVAGLEYLVVDGGSTDETAAILREYGDRIHATVEPDEGQADAVNKGLKAASGDIIGWVNSDDVFYPGALGKVLAAFEAHPGADVIYGEADHIDERDRILEHYGTEPFDYERLKDVCFLCQPAVFFRRTVVERYGPLQVACRYSLDYEYWLRILGDKPPLYLRETLAGSRLHADTKTLGHAEAVHREIIQMLAGKFGTPPARWIYNLAHVVVRERGLTRATREQDKAFVGALVVAAEDAFVRYAGGVPDAERATLDTWRAYAGRARWR
jgi:glycosyltransferase involved in cell wall biosynthesis